MIYHNNTKHFPAHMKKEFPTIHSWRKHKRAQAKIAKKAIHDLLIGCAYTPAKNVGMMHQMIDEVVEQLSIKQWGR